MREDMLNKPEGTGPERSFLWRTSVLSRRSWLRVLGMGPVSDVLPRLRNNRKERFARWGEMVPFRVISERSRAATRWCRRLQVTPIQPQKDALGVQFVDRMPKGSATWSLNASSEARSVKLLWGIEFAKLKEEEVESNTRKRNGRWSMRMWGKMYHSLVLETSWRLQDKYCPHYSNYGSRTQSPWWKKCWVDFALINPVPIQVASRAKNWMTLCTSLSQVWLHLKRKSNMCDSEIWELDFPAFMPTLGLETEEEY